MEQRAPQRTLLLAGEFPVEFSKGVPSPPFPHIFFGQPRPLCGVCALSVGGRRMPNNACNITCIEHKCIITCLEHCISLPAPFHLTRVQLFVVPPAGGTLTRT